MIFMNVCILFEYYLYSDRYTKNNNECLYFFLNFL